MRKTLAFLQSTRLAAALIALLAAGCALATLLPAAMGGYFGSVFFLGPAFLLFANLSACAAGRFARALRGPGPRRHGPDVVHLGLMVLLVGSVLSASGRREASVSMAPGQTAALSGGRTLRLESFERVSYPDGRPRDWVSVVSVLRGEEVEIGRYELRMNRPLRLGGFSVYQAASSAGDGPALSGLMAVSDPGYPVALAALCILAAGAFLTLAQKAGARR